MGLLDSFTGGAVKRAEGAGRALTSDALYNSAGISTAAYGDAQNFLGRGSDNFQRIYNTGIEQLGGLGLYGDALGANGAEGVSRARGAFQAAPGYEWEQQQAADQLSRRANALGGGGIGGNTWTALQDRAQQIARTGYNDWITQLGNLDARYRQTGLGASLGGAQGTAGINAAQAGTAMNYAQQQAGIRQGGAQQMANSLSREGMAEAQGNANLWSAGINALSGLSGMPGGFNGAIKGISNFFGG